MKKYLTVTVMLCIMLCLNVFAFAGTQMVHNYDYADLAALQEEVSVWEGGAAFNVKLSTTHKDSGKSMQIIPIGEANGLTYGVIVQSLPTSAQNWEGAEGIQFWADATGGTATAPTYISIQFMFDDCNTPDSPERWCGKAQMSYQTIDAGGTVENKVFGAGGLLTLLDGFKGIVKIPFTSCEALGWSLVDDELQLDAIKTIYFGIDAEFYKNKEVFIDSVQVYGSEIGNSSSSSSSSSSSVSSSQSSSSATSSAVISSVSSEVETSQADSSEVISNESEITSEAESQAQVSSEDEISESEESEPADTSSAASSSASDSEDGEKDNSVTTIIIILVVVVVVAAIVTFFIVKRKKA